VNQLCTVVRRVYSEDIGSSLFRPYMAASTNEHAAVDDGGANAPNPRGVGIRHRSRRLCNPAWYFERSYWIGAPPHPFWGGVCFEHGFWSLWNL